MGCSPSTRRPKSAAWRSALCLAIAATTAPVAWAQSKSSHAVLDKYLDNDVAIVGWLDTAKFDLNGISDALQVPRAQADVAAFVEKIRSLKVNRVYVIGNVPTLLGSDSEVAALLPSDDPASVEAALRKEPLLGHMVYRTDSNVLIVGTSSGAIDAVTTVHGTVNPNIRAAIDSCAGSHGVAVAVPWSFGSLITAMNPKATQEGDIGKLIQSLRGLEWLSASGELPPGNQNVQAKFVSTNDAKSTVDIVSQLIKQVSKDPLPIQLTNDLVSIPLSAKTPLIESLLAKARNQASASVVFNNMKQISLAMYNFLDIHQTYPPQSITSKEGKPLLSWRVLLLPYIEQQALYNQFHLDEPWDSPHNLPLSKSIPQIYRSKIAGVPEGNTCMLAVIAKNSLMGKPGAPSKISSITDGTSNTIWLVESSAERSVPWTKPDDLVIDSSNPLQGCQVSDNKIAVGMLDGSVRNLSSRIGADLANALISINGGELIDSAKMDGP